MQRPDQRKKSKGSSNWIGLVIFLLIIAGQPIINIVSNIVARISNNTVMLPSYTLPLLIGGFVLLAILVTLAQNVQKRSQPGKPQWPTSPSMPPFESPAPRVKDLSRPVQTAYTPPRVPESPHGNDFNRLKSRRQNSFHQSDITAQKLPGPPRFEPIVTARVLVIGIVGLVFLGMLLVAGFVFWLVQVP